MKKDLLGIADLSRDEIYRILDTAEAMREIGERPIKKVPTLRGKTVVNLFYEPSTRTRTSFEIAEKRLSADTLNIAVAASSVLKGETLADTAMNIEAMAPDMIVLRHASSGACHLLVAHLPIADHQRRRRHARASDAGAARRLHDPAAQAAHRGAEGRDRRRPAAQPGAAVERPAADQARRRGLGERSADAGAAGHRAARRARLDVGRRGGRRRRRHHDAAHSAGADAGRLLPVAARVLQRLRHDRGARRRARSRTSSSCTRVR